MSPRSRTAVPQQVAHQRAAAYDDARSLAVELGRGSPSRAFDQLAAGIVLMPDESVYRSTEAWIRMQTSGVWGQAQFVNVLLSDQRLLCRLSDGRWTSLWWNGVVGLHVDLAGESVTLDYGDGEPVAFSGGHAAVLGLAAIGFVHGPQALIQHPALMSLRRMPAADA